VIVPRFRNLYLELNQLIEGNCGEKGA
jgi:hypothetical protein